MNYLQRSILAISMALVALLAFLVLRSVNGKVESVPVAGNKSTFVSQAAYENTVELVTRFPERAMGTDGGRAAADWLASKMKAFGLRTEQQEFYGWLKGRRVQGRNVIGIDDGVQDRMIVLLAHYDVPFHVREGAMDDASGVGVLLELARVFSAEEQEKTLVFIASDGEEWGMLGARHYLKAVPNREKLFAALSLDYVRLEHPEKIYLVGEGQFRGYAPPWLWSLSRDCVTAAGGTPMLPSPLMQYVSHAVDISSTDQGPFVAAGIPAINLGGNKQDSPLAREIYHTPRDTHENLSPGLFAIYGQAAEKLIYSLDAASYLPDGDNYVLSIGNDAYVGRSALLSLQISLFVPLILATCFQYFGLRRKEKFVQLVLADAVNFALYLLPWLVSLAALYIMVAINYIPKFHLYPATPLDPFLFKPIWGAVAVAAAAFCVTWAVVVLVRRNPALRAPDFAVSKAVGLDLLLSFSILALWLNGFAATLFLAPSALLVIWLERGRTSGRALLNVALFVLAAIPFAFLLVHSSTNLRLGWFFLWYLFLGAAYRFFSPAAMVITVGVLTVWGRLLQQSLSGKESPMKLEIEENELLEGQG